MLTIFPILAVLLSFLSQVDASLQSVSRPWFSIASCAKVEAICLATRLSCNIIVIDHKFARSIPGSAVGFVPVENYSTVCKN